MKLSVVIVVVLYFCTDPASSCDSQKSSKCFEGLADTFAFAGALMRAVNQWTLTSSCAVIGATSKCVQNYGCTDTEDISVEWGWTGIKDSLNYLCTDGKQGLVKFQTCMTRNVESYYAQLLGCLELIAEPKAKTDCSYYNSQLACYAGAARDHCGSEDFAVKYYTKAYQPMTTLESGCQYSYEKNRLF